MREDEFFAGIAKRLGRSSALTTAPARDVVGAPDFWQSYALPEEERLEKFCVELEKLGGSAVVYDSKASLLQGLSGFLETLQPRTVGMWSGAFTAEFDVDRVLAGREVVYWGTDGANSVARMAQVDVGITGCDFAIADTGTVVLMSDIHKGRSVSLLPSVHVVLIKSSQIRTRMGEVWAEVLKQHGGKLPSSINFISGPSRSSDIENDLSIGVHGPAAVYALIWQE
jgi:L-lactate dehydrogenase complex protein LldG